jgi:hypothetical protein
MMETAMAIVGRDDRDEGAKQFEEEDRLSQIQPQQ